MGGVLVIIVRPQEFHNTKPQLSRLSCLLVFGSGPSGLMTHRACIGDLSHIRSKLKAKK